jgi:hypothetical protein
MIIVSVVFGVSLQSAFWGIISFIIFSVLFGLFYEIIGPMCGIFWEWFTNPKPTTPQKPTPRPKPVRYQRTYANGKKVSPVIFWVAFFVVSYMVSDLFSVSVGALDHLDDLPIWLFATLPMVPFLVISIITIISRVIKKRTNRKS